MPIGVKDKVVTITGAASGIGLETSKWLASQGAKVSMADVQEGPLKNAASDIESAGGKVIYTVVDVRKRSQVEDWIKRTVEHFGKIDGCANLAGVIAKQQSISPIEDIDDADWDFVMDVNVKGVLNAMRAQIPNMNDGGSIVNASSILGLRAFPLNAAYAASKHAVIGLTRVAAKELGKRGIRANCLNPGTIDTPMLAASAAQRGSDLDLSAVPLGRRGQPIELAHLIEFLISDASTYISGTCQSIDGGWNC